MTMDQAWAAELPWRSRRERTAITRLGLSMPTRAALVEGVIDTNTSVLDYGSGRGVDVRMLGSVNVEAVGWDPFFESRTAPAPQDVVLLQYVLNVIEDPDERRATLRSAWALARRALVVSARLHWERRRIQGDALHDGVLTSRGTFQRLFAPAELRDLVQEVTGQRVVVSQPGVIYAFRNDVDRLQLLARRATADVSWFTTTDAAGALKAVVNFVEQRGRMPLLEEIPVEMLSLLRHLNPRELRRLCMDAANRERVAEGARHTVLNTLLVLGMDLFNGRSSFSAMPITVRADVRSHFTSYKEACRRSERLLWKLRDSTYLRNAMRNSTGKLTPSALYTHRSAMNEMPVVLRLYEYCALIAAGRPEGWTLTKLHHDKRQVSWLSYPDFRSDPHPRLAWSYTVDLSSLESTFRSYDGSTNRPLLHRKHEFLSAADPNVPKYRRLTETEVRAGLYASPHLIGSELGWQSELDRCGVTLRGHRLIRQSPET